MNKGGVVQKAQIAVVGAGWWATEYHLPFLKARGDDVEIVAVSRLGREEFELVKQKFDIPFASEDFREVIEKTRPHGVVIASPHVAHYENAFFALKAGAHAMVEKPMATTAQQARELEQLACATGRQILVPHGWNFTHYVPKAAEWMQDGRIGELRHFTLQMGSALMDLFSGQPMSETAKS